MIKKICEHNEIFKTFLLEMEKSILASGEATEHWRRRCVQIEEDARRRNRFEFLRWPSLTDFSVPESYVPAECYDTLRQHPDWAARWFPLTRETKVGSPRKFSRDFGTSPILVQHAYHLLRYEAVTGKSLLDCDVVFEFGGGYGSFCRLLKNAGFGGLHAIYDLPHVSHIQRLYLALSGFNEVPKEEIAPRSSHAFCLLTGDDVEGVLSSLSGAEVGFVATWSLGEAPIAVRQKLFPRLHSVCSKYLIAYEAVWDGIDNIAYFDAFCRSRPELGWRREEKLPNYYLFG
jgi:hypothetical protein